MCGRAGVLVVAAVAVLGCGLRAPAQTGGAVDPSDAAVEERHQNEVEAGRGPASSPAVRKGARPKSGPDSVATARRWGLDLRNATIPVDRKGPAVTFVDGLATGRPGCARRKGHPGCSSYRILDVAYADLDGDGHEEAVVLLQLPEQVVKAHHRIVVYRSQRKHPRIAASQYLFGEEVSGEHVEQMTAADGEVVIRGRYRRFGGLSIAYTTRFKLQGKRLVEVAQTPPPPPPPVPLGHDVWNPD
jgi:hypothetical protein